MNSYGEDADLRRILLWNRILLLLLLGAVGWGAVRLMAEHPTSLLQLRARWSDGGLAFISMSEGPCMVTYLEVANAQSEGDKAVAQLPTPIAFIDSRGARLDREELQRLIWRDIFGHQVAAPVEGAPLRALYYRPLRTPSTEP